MPTATEAGAGPTRRALLQALGASVALGPWQSTRAQGAAVPAELLACWQQGTQHRLGRLALDGTRWSVTAQCELPARAHGLHPLGDGSVLVAARRPGDWLLRWQPRNGTQQWHWIEGDQRLNGHVLTVPQQPHVVYTTETDRASGAGLLGVRELATLALRTHWPTHGLDPHQLLALPRPLGALPAGTLLVANGGIATQAERGRSKLDLAAMDSSLVALDARDGRRLGQWRLPDARLSIRHLAWDAVSAGVGIALQAEHDDVAARVAAPVLAVWQGGALQLAQDQPALQGYGGSICAAPGGGYVVSCPRADALVRFDAQGRYQLQFLQRDVCPVAADAGQVYAGGLGVVVQARGPDARVLATAPSRDAWQFDNHWQLRSVI